MERDDLSPSAGTVVAPKSLVAGGAYQDIATVDEIEEYRPTNGAQCSIEESVGDVFVDSNNRSNLDSYSTRSGEHKTGSVKTHKSKLWQPTE